jgi:HSP20 family protein
MRTLVPWSGMTTIRREMDRLFDRFLEPAWDSLEATGEWMPKLDVTETKDAVVVTAEVPGVEPKDLQVTVQGDLLVIKGEKEETKEQKDERVHRTERSYGAFTRAVRLPAPVNAEKVDAGFKNGVLTVTLPKTPEAKGTMIPVKVE